MRAQERAPRAGFAMLEIVLIGIPTLFLLISLVHVAWAMWVYHSLAYSVREGARYAGMHGYDCGSPHTCSVKIKDIAGVIKAAGPGYNTSTAQLTFTPASGSAISESMAAALSDNTVWPPSGANAYGVNVKISVKYPVSTIVAMFWPEARSGTINDTQSYYLVASSTQAIQY